MGGKVVMNGHLRPRSLCMNEPSLLGISVMGMSRCFSGGSLPRAPNAGVVVPSSARDESPVRREAYMVDCFLVSVQAGDWLFTRVGGIPQNHGQVITRGYDSLGLAGGFKSFLGLYPLRLFRRWYVLGVVEKARPEDKLTRQRDVIDPMLMSRPKKGYVSRLAVS